MPARKLAVTAPDAALAAAIDRLVTSLGLPKDFSVDVLVEADVAAMALPSLITRESGYADRTDLEFVTLDPPGAIDLDQAVFIERLSAGYRVWYAIADVPYFVWPGGEVEAESFRRGQTVYALDRRLPLYPTVLSEGVASLLADGKPRLAALWQIDLDAAGAVVAGRVDRAIVRNRAQLAYDAVQADLDAGRANETVRLVAEVGRLRQAQERARGGVSLDLPEQVADHTPDGWKLSLRQIAPIESWNAQISLLTGMVAAQLMLHAGVGILRLVPPAAPANIEHLRRIAASLGLPWPATIGYPDFLRSLRPDQPTHLAMLSACRSLFRGAAYTTFDQGAPRYPVDHGAVAAPYAHVTAPLRRLVDRFGTEICLAASVGLPPPGWVRTNLTRLPAIMAASEVKARQVENGALNLLEALVLADSVGQTFAATVTARRDRHATIQLVDPAVEASVTADVALGSQITVRLTAGDVETGRLTFEM